MLSWRRVAVSFLVLLGLAGAGVYGPTWSAPVASADTDPRVVSKGRYLASVICVECHTQRVEGNPLALDRSKLFAGGERFDLPFGTVYSSNITGMGTMTAAEIKRGINEGVGRGGRLLVLMPWESYAGLADEDVDGLVAYLQSLPLIENPVPRSDLRVPREALHAEAATHAGISVGPRAPTGRDNPVRGEYLAKSLLGCTACHGADLAGGTPPFFAPNLTPDKATGIGTWSKEDIVRATREGRRPDKSRMGPVMPWATSYRNLTDDDMYNVIAYLRSVAPVSRTGGGPPPG